MRGRGRTLAAVALCVLAACSDDDDGAARPTVREETTAPTTSSTTSTTADPSARPPLENTGDDFDKIIRSLVAYRQWNLQHPDQADIDGLYHPGSAATAHRDAIDALLEEGLRLNDVGAPVVQSLTRLSSSGENQAAFTVLLRQAARAQMVDAGGRVQREVGTVGDTRYFVALVRSPEGAWRISQFEAVDE